MKRIILGLIMVGGFALATAPMANAGNAPGVHMRYCDG